MVCLEWNPNKAIVALQLLICVTADRIAAVAGGESDPLALLLLLPPLLPAITCHKGAKAEHCRHAAWNALA
jgi:hypothetical protein